MDQGDIGGCPCALAIRILKLVLVLSCVVSSALNSSSTEALAKDVAPNLPLEGIKETITTPSISIRSFSFGQDFEAGDPFQFWTSNVGHRVHYKGLSDERASSGQRSFKLDVTFEEDGYAYWYIPLRVPTVGKLRFSGDLWVTRAERAEVALGTNVSLVPAPYTGVNVLDLLGSPSHGWVTQQSDLISDSAATAAELTERYLGACDVADVGIWTNRVGLFTYGKKGGRITVYVDNVRISGSVPEPDAYRSHVDKAWQAYSNRVAKTVAEKVSLLAGYQDHGRDPGYQSLVGNSKKRMTEIHKRVAERGYPTAKEMLELNQLVTAVEFGGKQERDLAENPARTFVIYAWDPITSKQILPRTYPIPARLSDSVSIQACRGEFEPASFVVRALKPLAGVKVAGTDLVGSDGKKIPSSAVDVRLVKSWYQAGRQVWETGGRMLVPELLLKDDQLIKVDLSSQRNYVRVMLGQKSEYIEISTPGAKIPEGAVLVDSKTIMPFDLEAGTNMQVWITVHVPQDAAPGRYTGSITVTAGDAEDEVAVHLEVLPFDLAPPVLEYAVYYRGKLTRSSVKSTGSEWKTPEQYQLELEDMRDHGILYPTLYQGYDEALLGRSLEIRGEVALPTDRLYVLGQSTGRSTDPAVLARLADRVRVWNTFVDSYGYDQVFFYGIDEARGKMLVAQRAAWNTVKTNGGKVFVACHEGDVDLVGDILDVAVLSGLLEMQEILKWHEKGKRVLMYSSPKVGIEDPTLYRRNYGLLLLQNEYDGAMDYAYQHGFGDIWNDFDSSSFRDHVFAYPVSDGVIDTVQFEGFREAVDDVRYASTLARLSGWSRAELAAWVREHMGNDSSPAEMRTTIVELITSREKE